MNFTGGSCRRLCLFFHITKCSTNRSLHNKFILFSIFLHKSTQQRFYDEEIGNSLSDCALDLPIILLIYNAPSNPPPQRPIPASAASAASTCLCRCPRLLRSSLPLPPVPVGAGRPPLGRLSPSPSCSVLPWQPARSIEAAWTQRWPPPTRRRRSSCSSPPAPATSSRSDPL
jgi:hypothetical protein